MGCIMAELLNRGHPIFAGKTELNQFEVICDIIGSILFLLKILLYLQKRISKARWMERFFREPKKRNSEWINEKSK